MSFWISLHLGDQGRHGSSQPYDIWSKNFASRSCVVEPPKTQGIIEFHNKSVKHITMNSKRDQIDKVVSNLCLDKRSKSRQFEISQSRKRTSSTKLKDTLPKKIAEEKWSKRNKKKQSTGPGNFQKNRTKNCIPEIKEDWQKVSIIPWGGMYRISSGESIDIIN